MPSPVSRICSTQDLGPYLQRLDAWLRPDQNWSLADEYPGVFGPKSRARHHLLESGGKLTAHAASLDMEMHVRGKTWRPSLVGSVVVDPNRRGEGLGRRLMQSLVRDFEQRDRDALALWSDQPEFYAKLGFRSFGKEIHLAVPPNTEGRQGVRGTLRSAQARDSEQLLQLHHAKSVHSRRLGTEMQAYLQVPACEFTLLEREGQVVAYCVIGKGLDFPLFVHEFAGSEHDLEAMFRILASKHRCTLGVLVPLWRAELIQAFPDAESFTNPLALGIVRYAPVDAAFDGFDSI
ncbi:MAG: hypothetical protein CSA62_09580 [Planctomycetota bacterium]|nr:MAG: hypothetical protein CSA62_09580 [Planctomycetota bacterium]